MKDDLRAELDHDDHERVRVPLKPRRKPRGKNWLAWQIALGIVVGGCTLWILDVAANYILAKVLMGQLQLMLPGVGR